MEGVLWDGCKRELRCLRREPHLPVHRRNSASPNNVGVTEPNVYMGGQRKLKHQEILLFDSLKV